ncbi:MAG TPA: transglycosylase SLT domain-containing protein [Candidatus Sulfomarinibacteraceae bacterium]|nr:transglycosylase SLT domain-containing protein [Candidatus Sulfomarinibacteraceae bacterium]
MTRRLLLFSAILLLLVGCNSEPDDVARQLLTRESEASEAVGSLLATPTLLPQLASVTAPPPTPPITPTASATPTETPPPTPTPLPEERLELGQTYLVVHQDFDAAAREFQASLSAPGALEPAQQRQAIWGLSQAYLGSGRHEEAIDALNRFLSLDGGDGSGSPPAAEPGDGPDVTGPSSAAAEGETGQRVDAYFYLAEASRHTGDCSSAIEQYRNYLAANNELAAYVEPRIADCYSALGDTASAVAALEAAAAAPAHRLTAVETRQKLADAYLEAGNYAAAVVQYDAIHDLAETENTRGQMMYLAGRALMEAGNEQAAFERYLRAVNEYPRAHESYLGLVALVEAEQPVDSFQRGLVDYYARAYAPAVAAFEDYLQANAADYRADTHLYLAWSYEGLGNLEAALAELERYAAYGETETGAPHAAEAASERAKLYDRAGQRDTAIEAYLDVVRNHPQSAEAADSAWRAALLAEFAGDVPRARELYRDMAAAYPGHEQAPRALFRAGLLAWESDADGEAVEAWQVLADAHPQSDYGAAALVWLMRALPEEQAQPYVVTATQFSGAGYYPLRARELAEGVAPFEREGELDLSADEAAERAAAEAWLASWLSLEEADVSGELSPELAQDTRLRRGEALWAIGLNEEAKRELEAVRAGYARNALASYQLALYFRDLGLYRSSILASDAVLLLSGESVFEAPRLIGRLSYPIYYQDLIMSLAEAYEYDPLLQFALVRQESLYESFIGSHAGAQGLSQVMPATGEHIAQRLQWPNYTTADLHRPHVGLAFGAFYLSEQLDTFGGDVYAALSAYNAGPGNAARWQADAPDDPDLYLETVDYAETRLYIQRIYSGFAIYRHLYAGGI